MMTSRPEVRKRPRDSFNGQSEIVGYIPTRHGEIDDLIATNAIRHIDKKGGDSLGRAAAAEKQGVVLRAPQALHRANKELPHQPIVDIAARFECPP